ncbi:LysR family transcriptional regulator [Caldimonas sp. KR1-144]|uniref:LysR family transcriptional regulator n=1 Tax=Caldimonas sp. KR1-144 TaxID=3400911 RepID=UPI003C0F2F1B
MPRRTFLPPAAGADALNWDDLRYALAIAEQGSLAGAARALGVRHSTVLRRLDALEARLGARLFERQRSGYAPTEAGELLVEHAGRLRPALQEMQRRILGRDLQLSGTLRLNVAHITTLYLLPRPLADFVRAHPGIGVEVDEASQLVDLSRRDADVALRLSAEVPQHLVGRELGRARFRVYARRGERTLPQRRTPLDKLIAQAPWIGYERDRRARFFDRWMHEQVPSERVVLRVDLLHSALAMVRTGLGVAVLPSFVEPHEPLLMPVSDDIPALETPLWLLTHPDLRATARVTAFMQQVGHGIAQALAQAR